MEQCRSRTSCSKLSEDGPPPGTTGGDGANPFLTASTLPFQAPPFDRITDAHYLPAINEGIKQNLEEIDRIAVQDSVPTFANTIPSDSTDSG